MALSAQSSAPQDAKTRLSDTYYSDSKRDGKYTPNYGSKLATLHAETEHTATISSKMYVRTIEAKSNEQSDNKKLSTTDRLQRSRERNRMHARKTRQRKKEHMQKVQNCADELKLEQIRLKQAINEKNTASILVGLFAGPGESSISADSKVESLLKRPTENIPDPSKIPELPALILPGQHTGKTGKRKSNDDENDELQQQQQDDGIDYVLLGKCRSSCTPAELDEIRRERNRMHAKRTRDRKRIFMEEMEVMCKTLEEENNLLQSHYDKLANKPSSSPNHETTMQHTEARPRITPALTPELTSLPPPSTGTHQSHDSKGDFMDQINSLLAAAGSFQRVECEINAISCAESDASASSTALNDSLCEDDEHHHLDKKPRPVPKSITTTSMTM